MCIYKLNIFISTCIFFVNYVFRFFMPDPESREKNCAVNRLSQ
uniref:Uncharacterized protein n=1 Tax=Anguilla anguilla TaxID=7936 RepID=A0A0E9RHR1_ANGAN